MPELPLAWDDVFDDEDDLIDDTDDIFDDEEVVDDTDDCLLELHAMDDDDRADETDIDEDELEYVPPFDVPGCVPLRYSSTFV